MDKLKVIVVVIILVAAVFSAIIVDGSTRQHPSEVVWQRRRIDDYSINDQGAFSISENVMFVGARSFPERMARDELVIAVDMDENELLWNHSHHEPTSRIFSVCSNEDKVFSSCHSGQIIAADIETGELIWNYTHPADYTLSWAIQSTEERVYTGWRHSELIAFDEETGEIMWNHTLHQDDILDIYVEDDVVYTASEKVMATDAETGDELWTYSLQNGEPARVFVKETTLYIGSTEGELIAYDLEKEERIWSSSHHDDNDDWITSITSIDGGNGKVYTGSGGPSVIAVDAEDGEKIWDHQYHGEYTGGSSPHIAGIEVVEDEIYSACGARRMIVVEDEGGITTGVSRTFSIISSAISTVLADYWFPTLLIAVAVGGVIALIVGEDKIDFGGKGPNTR